MKLHSLVLAALMLLACSDDHSCSAIGCNSGLEVAATSTDPLDSGRYRLVVTLDSGESSCEFVIPEQVPGQFCPEGGPWLATLRRSGFGISVRVAAERVTVRVEHDGAVIGSADYTPAYRPLQPNGPNCGEPCYRANAEEFTIEP